MTKAATALQKELSSGNKIDLNALSESMGAHVFEIELPDGVTGKIAYENGDFIISLQQGMDDFSKNFTLAHELAHLALHRDLLIEGGKPHMDVFFLDKRRNPPEPFTAEHEAEAIGLGAEILAPTKVILAEFNKQGRTLSDAFYQSASEMLNIPEAFLRSKVRANRELFIDPN